MENRPRHLWPRRYLYLIVFVGGMTTLAVEMTASRLLGSVFGTSNLVWANIIGLMLLYLAIGYFIGGRIADRSPQYATLYRILLWASFLSAAVPFLSKPVLSMASQAVIGAQAALALGSFIAVMVLFSVPVTLLGMTSPFAIRLLLTSVENTGKQAGFIYALSTFGSLLGTFLPVFVTIPTIGTTMTFVTFSGLLFVLSLIGLIQQGTTGHAITALLMVGLLGFAALTLNRVQMRYPLAEGFQILYESESPYNYIQVQEDANGYRYLFLNEGQGIHSQWHPTRITYQRTWSFFLTAHYFNPAPPEDISRLLVIGLAAGTIPRQYLALYPDLPIDGIEIDGGIVTAGERYFQMNRQDMPTLNVYVQDGRYVLNQLADEAYSVVAIDAYRPPYIPWHLTTVEFFEEVQARLDDNGVVAINVGRTETDRRLVEALTSTLDAVFPTVHTMDVPNTFNTILVATNQSTDTMNLQQNLSVLENNGANPILLNALDLGVQSVVPTIGNGTVFTDDHAPVEQLVDSIVLNFLLSEDIETIR